MQIGQLKTCDILPHPPAASAEPPWSATAHFQKCVCARCVVQCYRAHCVINRVDLVVLTKAFFKLVHAYVCVCVYIYIYIYIYIICVMVHYINVCTYVVPVLEVAATTVFMVWLRARLFIYVFNSNPASRFSYRTW